MVHVHKPILFFVKMCPFTTAGVLLMHCPLVTLLCMYVVIIYASAPPGFDVFSDKIDM